MALWARSGTERCDVLSRLLCAESPTPSFLGVCLEPDRALVCAGRGLVKEAPPVKEAPFARTVVAHAAFLCDAPAALLLQDIDSACSWCAKDRDARDAGVISASCAVNARLNLTDTSPVSRQCWASLSSASPAWNF